MPICTKCPHEADVKAGRYNDMDFQSTPCFACRFSGDTPSKRGMIHISSDTMPQDELDADWKADHPADDDYTLPEPVRAFFVAWMRLPQHQRDAVAWRCLHPGEPLTRLAEERGVSVQAIHAALREGEAILKHATGLNFLFRTNTRHARN